MSPRPLILLSNDDGYSAPGLQVLREALLEHADVVVCAPEINQSATSHSLSLNRILRLRAAGEGVFVIDGTPADCVYVALHAGERVLPRRPSLCVSGMNHGLNLGLDVFYSGTVAAAREAALKGIPSIALSADSKADPRAAAQLGARIALGILALARATTTRLFNVNVPPGGGGWPVRATRLGRREYEGGVVFRQDPRGAEYLWIGGGDAAHHASPGSDTEAFDEGVVSVTPLSLVLDHIEGLEATQDLVAALGS